MLTDTLKTLVYELFLKIFYKNNNKVNNFFDIFFITYKSSIKTFLIYIYIFISKIKKNSCLI